MCLASVQIEFQLPYVLYLRYIHPPTKQRNVFHTSQNNSSVTIFFKFYNILVSGEGVFYI